LRRVPAPATRSAALAAHPRRRCRALLAALLLAFGAVGGRLVQLQVISPEGYAARGAAQRHRVHTLPAERGSIFDRNGNELAMSARQHTVWADPRKIIDIPKAAVLVASVVHTDPIDLRHALSRPGAAFAYVARQVDGTTAKAVDALDLAGVYLMDESKRFEPAGGLARSVIGGTDVDNRGISGLELQYESSLVGVPGSLEIEQTPDGRTIAGGDSKVTPSLRGRDLVLTIDRSLQYAVERELAAQMDKFSAKGATAIVMNPKTGEILAMANLARDADGHPVTSGENRAVTRPFEPGSVNKVVTMAAAMEEGIVSPQTVLTVKDKLRIYNHTYSDHENHPPMRWSITDILTQSSNIGTIQVAQRLGPARLASYLERFGLGAPTGLNFPQETKGVMPKHWTATDIGSVPIGSGLGVTALQMLQMYNTLANGGVWTQPRLVREVVDASGQETPLPPAETRRVVSERTAAQMTAMLVNVVKAGTGMPAAIQGYTVAGKTGTARKPDGHGGYAQGAYVASFAGFVPAEAPTLSAIVSFDEPHPYYAAQSAAPVFAKVNQYALRLFRIPPPDQAGKLADVPAAQSGPASMKD
jgi:cell division protein FtsI (penicillin-binding protein 3)